MDNEKYAKVIVKNNTRYTDNLFTYKIPEFLVDGMQIGHRVLVPFGKGNKPIEAYVFSITDEKEVDINYKEIFDILDEYPIFKEEDINLIKWMRNRYLCTFMDCILLLHPKGYKVDSFKEISLSRELENLDIESFYTKIDSLNKNRKFVINKIIQNKNKIKVEKLIKEKALEENINPKDLKLSSNMNNLLLKMKEDKLIDINWNYKSQKNEKKICYVSLNINPDDINDYILDNKIRLGQKQKEIIEFLRYNEEIEINDLIKLLNVGKESITSLQNKNLINFQIKDYYRKPDELYDTNKKEIVLNHEQKKAVEKITSEMFEENKKPYMIHGVTGSGKTEVYMEIIDYALKQGLDSIFLVPEISLTPQTISRLKNRFGNIVGVFHSKLSEGEKHDVFKAIKQGKIRILIGARSALFAPFNSLGVIIIDEFHEGAYKSEMNPKFSAIEVGKYMALKRNITLVLGSATPSVEEYYRAKENEYELITIKERANKKPLPKIELIDMKNELNLGNKSIFSYKLQSEIEEALNKNNQVILFLNRRGYGNFVSCRKCGYVFSCKNCDISLTYHKYKNIGTCHYCGYEENIPKTCPECGSDYVKPFGIGTEKVEEEVKKLFKNAKVLRMDKDTTSKKGELDKILNKFKNKEANVLIGTQMLSKGLDFEDVTLVGILSADMMLNFPDFRSFETTFQLITQVSGRAGRSHKEGKVVLQTYDTDHYVIRRSLNYDFEGFYEDEIKVRKIFNYAPFNNMISVVVSGKNESLVEKNINKMYNSLIYLLKERGVEDFDFILGPNACAISKINQNYRYQLLFKDDNIEINLLKGIIKYICITKKEVVFDKDVNISIDVNPNNIL
ncbi:MAG: primosomal protein N' [Terrisporobacter othiniensis]|uniref:primosomal protein N' n=1 Tax=Terrisporobacter othiniensis TaxID=1577792 RepID=UPI002905323E|nr:primosomal protein N' [Terrisporobacter othiniensis]MDU2199728.1 primosomal protein N' [Terrisporobacter othiniensis]